MASGSTGNCYLCGIELGKTAMKNHLLKEHGLKDGGQLCYLLKIEGAYDKDYWLYIDVPVEKTLSSVDSFLRKIWLECCGHMSGFTVGRQYEVGKSRKLSMFAVGDKLRHEYDYGSTTECDITIAAKINREPQREIVRLLARNVPPQFKCKTCGEPAEYICCECIWQKEDSLYCADCADEHEHDDMMLPISNSPRSGECGYEGELDTFEFDPRNLPKK